MYFLSILPSYTTAVKLNKTLDYMIFKIESFGHLNFLAAKGAAREGLIFGVSHTYANVIFIQIDKV